GKNSQVHYKSYRGAKMSSSHIPFVDLVTLHRELEDDLLGVVRSALHTAGFIGGPMVEQFETNFAAFCDARHCIGVSSGTDALRFALMAAGVQPGEIVITVPNTFIATTEAISQAGARPEFVDIDERTYNMNPLKLQEFLETECSLDRETGRPFHRRLQKTISAVVPVHLYGQMADMDPILELARRYNLIVVEDACQAHGAEYFSAKQNRWCKAGSMGHAAAFSFYPGKNLGACGEGGAVTTNDAEIARKIRMLRDHGQSKKYYHDVEGYNGRLDSIQAGILRVKLQHLSKWNEQRQSCARIYNELLAPLRGEISAPYEPTSSKAVYHLYVLRTAYREALQQRLSEAGIGTGIHYPIPLHLQAAYASGGWNRGDFPVTEAAAEQILSLPMYGGLKREQQERVTEVIAEFVSTHSTRRQMSAAAHS
ncbi:MAG TPA: DegT/DnrJ/EryC1/StrS family aminotransferase, partial [Candidatus Acidoferrales bacterium]|nr:DegT/DnrJ/EryC1/StrS family aminotransferase [Candidatus Acidoferrales bacterium]